MRKVSVQMQWSSSPNAGGLRVVGSPGRGCLRNLSAGHQGRLRHLPLASRVQQTPNELCMCTTEHLMYRRSTQMTRPILESSWIQNSSLTASACRR
jgi:hypothetical protein